MRVLSYDCANKNLGVVAFEFNATYNEDILNQLKKLITVVRETKVIAMACGSMDNNIVDNLNAINTELDILRKLCNPWDIKFINRYDHFPNCTLRSTKVKERCMMLKETTEKVNKIFPDPDVVLIEDQMSPNEKSRGVFYCLMYEYGRKAININATLKNKYDFGAGTLEKFILKYATSYMANKKHTEENFIYYLKDTNQIELIKDQTNVKDISDAFFQAVAFTLEYHNRWRVM